MPRPRSRFRGPAQSARLTQWIGPADQNYVAVGSGAKNIISSFSVAEPITVMRTRGMISVKPTSDASDLVIAGAIGVCIVSTEAFTAGIASIPGPFDEGFWGGWLVWRSFCYDFRFGSGTGAQYPDWNFEIDSKAMRKVSPNEVVVAVAESQAGAFSLFHGVRTLIKLS